MSLVQQTEWVNTLGYSPLLRYSVLASLLSEYMPEGVGISPTTLRANKPVMQQQQQLQLVEAGVEGKMDGANGERGNVGVALEVCEGVCVCQGHRRC